jgi:hypothetical protein
LEGSALRKIKIVVVVFSVVFASLLFASRGECSEVTLDLARLPLSPPPIHESNSLLGGLYIQEEEVTELTRTGALALQTGPERQYTQKRAEESEVPPARQRVRKRLFQFGIRLGALIPVHSRLPDDPAAAGLVGLDLRFPIPSYPPAKLELSLDTNTLGMDIKYNAALYNDTYEDYFDIIFSYVGYFPRLPDSVSPIYWGIGVGWAREVIRYNPVGSAPCDHDTNDSAVFQLKLGWDSGLGAFVEASYKKLLDSDRNIDNMWGLVIGFVR